MMILERKLANSKFRSVGAMRMTRKLKFLSAAASLLLATSLWASPSADSASAASDPALTSKVACKNGYTSVPLTSDREQALPLRLVASLECGQEVAVLSDMESYAVNVRTADGKDGYVARLFLTSPVAKVESSAPENAELRNGVARWQEGTPGSVSFPSGDNLVESLTANGITVQVSLQDTGWRLRANIAVMNAGAETINVLPKLLSLTEVAPARKPLRYNEPGRLSTALNHQLLWTACSARPIVSTTNASYRYSSPSSPNFLEHQQDLEETAARSQAALVDMVQEIKALALRDYTLKPGEKVAGAAWFDRDPKTSELVLRVPVGHVIFEFPLSFSK